MTSPMLVPIYKRLEHFPSLHTQVSTVQYQPTQRQIEDRFSVDFRGDRLLVGVYDGHGGGSTSEHISKTLPTQILLQETPNYAEIFQTIDDEILTRFTSDHSTFGSKSKEWEHNARLVRAGSMALILDISIGLDAMSINYANAGDCRAVVCNQGVIQQTTDLNAKTPSEVERLEIEHPGENDIVVGGRLFGKLMSTRGFGDGYYKLPNGKKHKKQIEILSSRSLSRGKVPLSDQYASYFYGYKSPPYITPKPVCGSFSFERAGFVILGTDGLWDMISSEDAARVVSDGIADGEQDLSGHLFNAVSSEHKPGDDVTIVVVHAKESV